MPTLDWIGKQAVIRHLQQLKGRTLRPDPGASAGDPESGNLIVQGDNLEALRTLLPYYGGQVKLIYIDPPYNTGEESWVYNDNVSSPEIRRWLHQVVGNESDDLSRHDKWLCMMYPRLQLLKKFLNEEGIICVSIDDNELGHLRLLMDEIFGTANNLGTFVWKRRSPSGMGKKLLSLDHEYVLVYGKDRRRTRLYGLEKDISAYPFIERDAQGNTRHFASTDLTLGMTSAERPNQFFPITNPRTQRSFEGNPNRVWRFAPETMAQVIAERRILWPDDPAPESVVPRRQQKREVDEPRPRYKTYYDPQNEKPKPFSSWIESNKVNTKEIERLEEEFEVSILQSGMNTESSKLMEEIFGSKVFAYPKPLSLVKSLVRMATRGDDIVLDTFAGSGTTGHAVLSMNNEDGGQRRFILTELEESVATGITASRMKKVIEGYGEVPGVGGGFRFCTLGGELFDELGCVSPDVTFDDLARHVFFSETQSPLPGDPSAQAPFIGQVGEVAYYLLPGSVLDASVLPHLRPDCKRHVVFADAHRLDRVQARQRGIDFRQLPYDVRQN